MKIICKIYFIGRIKKEKCESSILSHVQSHQVLSSLLKFVKTTHVLLSALNQCLNSVGLSKVYEG